MARGRLPASRRFRARPRTHPSGPDFNGLPGSRVPRAAYGSATSARGAASLSRARPPAWAASSPVRSPPAVTTSSAAGRRQLRRGYAPFAPATVARRFSAAAYAKRYRELLPALERRGISVRPTAAPCWPPRPRTTTRRTRDRDALAQRLSSPLARAPIYNQRVSVRDLSDLSAARRGADALRASPRMFDSDFLDRFSRVHPVMPLVFFVPPSCCCSAASAWTSSGGAPPPCLGARWPALWTFAEYWLHRTVFHFEPDHPGGPTAPLLRTTASTTIIRTTGCASSCRRRRRSRSRRGLPRALPLSPLGPEAWLPFSAGFLLVVTSSTT